MRLFAFCLVAMAACQFAPSGDGADVDAPPSGDDASEADGALPIDGADIDAPEIDAPVDAPIDAPADAPTDAPTDAAIDARMCPTAPNGCTAFTCAATSSCYYVCNAQAWTTARDRCVQGGVGCLATINSDAENACVASATNPTFPNLVWIGWRQSPSGSEPAGGWDWQCGSSTFVAGNWGSFEPNNSGGNEDCGAMAQGGAWIDGDCGSTLRFVCEFQ